MKQWVVKVQKGEGADWVMANSEVFYSRQAAESSMDELKATLSDREKNQSWPRFKVEPISPDGPKPRQLGKGKAGGESIGRRGKQST